MSMDSLPSAAQIRAARGLLGWSQTLLAERAGISRRTLTAIESGGSTVTPDKVSSVQAVLVEAGLEFVGTEGSEGVRRQT